MKGYSGFSGFGQTAAPAPPGYIPVTECELRVKSAEEAVRALVTVKEWPRLVGPGMLAGFILGWIVFK